jgi:tetratricopeptide (TPR) repeat protein
VAPVWGVRYGLVEAMSDKRDERLGRLLIRQGLLTAEQVERARLHPRAREDGLGGGLEELGLMTESELLTFVAKQFHTDVMALDGRALDSALATRLTFELCVKYDAVPVEVSARTLVVAMCDPGDFNALDDLRFRAGMNVRPVVAGRGAVVRGLRRLFPERMAALDAQADPVAQEARTGKLAPVQDEGVGAEALLRRRYAEGLALVRTGDQGLDHPGLGLSPEDQIVIRLCHELLYTAVAEELSYVRLELFDDATRVAFRRQELWEKETELPSSLRVRILWHFKGLGDLPLGTVRRPVQAISQLGAGATRVRWVRIFIVPTTGGQVVLLAPVPSRVDYRVWDSEPSDDPEAQRWWEAYRAGKHAQSEGRFSQAEVAFREGVVAAEERGVYGRLCLGETLIRLGQVLDAAGRPADAHPIFERAVDVQKGELGPDSPLLVGALTGLADVLGRLDRLDDAVAVYRQALLKTELAFGPEDLQVVWLMDRIRWICEDKGNLEEAGTYRDEVRRVLLELTGVDRRDVRFE